MGSGGKGSFLPEPADSSLPVVSNVKPPEPVQTYSVFQNAVASTLGASAVAIVVTPLDVVKIRLQSHVCPVAGIPCNDPMHVDGALDAARKIVRSEGVRGLWRGLRVTLLLTIPTTGIYFTLYDNFRMRLERSRPDAPRGLSIVAAGATARVIAATVASPLELARTTLQAGVGGEGATVLSVLRQVRKQDGMLAWWRGLGPTVLRDAPFSAIYWGVYEMLKHKETSILPKWMFDRGGEFGVYLSSGIGAGAIAAFCTVPPDVVKTRRQSSLVRNGTVDSGSMGVARSIMREEGLRGLFRGAGPRVAKVAPACAIMMGTFETIRKALAGNSRDRG